MKSESTLLIAEDDKDLLGILSETLQPIVQTIVNVSDGKELYKKVMSEPKICAVLSDINMPVMSGLEALKELRKQGQTIPVVFLTAYADKEKVIEALRLGAMDFLEKPFENDLLKKTVKNAIEFGAQLKAIDEEIISLSKKHNIQSENFEKFKAIQTQLLLMKINNNVFFKNKPR